MVLKLLGCVCIFGGGFLARWMQLSARRQSLETRAALLAALRRMAEEIRMARTPLPTLLSQLGREGATGSFFAAAAAGLQNGVPLAEAWNASLADLSLPQSDQAALAELGTALHGDEESVCKAISLAALQLSRSLEEESGRRRDRDRQTTALCFSASALLVILLI